MLIPDFCCFSMGKRKHADEPENLKRFRGLVNKLAGGTEALLNAHGGVYDQRVFTNIKKSVSKKEQRKEMKKFKKIRKNAFYEHKPVSKSILPLSDVMITDGR